MKNQKYPHILLPQQPETSIYRNPRSGRNSLRIKPQNRQYHGKWLKIKLTEAWEKSENELAVYQAERNGIYLEFKGEQGYELVINSLESLRSKNQEANIRVLNIREEDETRYATVYVPKEKKDYFFDKIEEYLVKETNSGNPKNCRLLDNINEIRDALRIKAFWQDPEELIPTNNPEWCEVWLSITSQETKRKFNDLLNIQGVISKAGYIDFPERSIKLIFANQKQLLDLIILSDNIAEVRKAKNTARFWTSSLNNDQAEWVKDLLGRLVIKQEIKTAICILDTGINYGHPLLNPILSPSDCQTVREEWGKYDHHSHGTLMAGVSEYGNLISCLLSSNQVTINHLLESVKILPINRLEKNSPELWGFVTSQAVSLAEIRAPERNRILCMAVTSEDTLDRGRPSSWSGALDQITSGATEEGEPKRFFVVSGGNVTDPNLIANYPQSQYLGSVHDPAQAWNVLTVGAFTEICEIQDSMFAGYKPIAPIGGLSPFTTTSSIWNDEWPIKPEIVMEGGNAAISKDGFIECDCPDLALLSTHYKPQESLFNHFNMTSAATAQAAWFAAQIAAQYPEFWPETIRGLIVHSAEWTDTLKQQFLPDDSKKSKKRMLRVCGFGVPNLERALYSASNNSTVISQTRIQPYTKGKSAISTSDMHLYDLPWPTSVLQDLPPQIDVQMRITLSYFIEPGPGEIGWKDRYRYSSHSLKFFIKTPTESKADFLRRVNKAARDEDEEYENLGSEADFWYFGSQTRHKGSIHSDIWHGTPQQLASSNIIAVVPGGGWWKERNHLKKWNKNTRYTLIVSIYTPEENVDIYTPILNQIKIPIQISSSLSER
jgi:hypothetical protein